MEEIKMENVASVPSPVISSGDGGPMALNQDKQGTGTFEAFIVIFLILSMIYSPTAYVFVMGALFLLILMGKINTPSGPSIFVSVSAVFLAVCILLLIASILGFSAATVVITKNWNEIKLVSSKVMNGIIGMLG